MSVSKLENLAVMGDQIAFAWSDGAETYLALEKLRKSCPCAACQGEPDVKGRVIVPHVEYGDRSYLLNRHAMVGGYAIQFFWADGHHTGIYSYDLLRSLGG